MKLKIKDIAVFAVFGALMFVSKIVMEFLPNVHLIGMFTILLTVIYRRYALFPIYIFVILTGAFNGFNLWWVPYLYLWTVLWGMAMLLPKNLPDKAAAVVYPLLCALHGLIYGTLYAPFQALAFGLNFDATVKWIIAGLPWDAVHAAGNFVAGLLILPLVKIMKKITRTSA